MSVPLSKSSKFKSIKNMIIKEAVKLGDVMPTNMIGLIEAKKKLWIVLPTDSVKEGDYDADMKAVVVTPDLPLMTSKLLNHLENIFESLIRDTQGRKKMISEHKQKRREKQKQMAMGQKADDERIQSSQSQFIQ